jgi:16S rRNA (adenine1518-N6/adenine1519-N6)-dimethyltransferase
MKAKKSLGQNFLRTEGIAKKIIAAANIKKSDTVLEIGAGLGALTKILLTRAGHVIAIEKDGALIFKLSVLFKKEIASGRLTLVNDDVFNIKKLSVLWERELSRSYLIVANIPYNITGRFLRFLFTLPVLPERAVLMLQTEVAKRIVATDKKESLLSNSVKAYSFPKIAFHVKARHFLPKPKVDSSILILSNISKKFFSKIQEKVFFNTLCSGFAHKRKLVKNNLGLNAEALYTCSILPNARAEELTLQNWKCLSEKI